MSNPKVVYILTAHHHDYTEVCAVYNDAGAAEEARAMSEQESEYVYRVTEKEIADEPQAWGAYL